MLIDAKLLPLKKRADDGDPVAQVKIADAYYQGNGAPLDYGQAKRYLIKVAANNPVDLPLYGYGTLLYTIGELCYHSGQMKEANEWYQKSKDYFRETYEDEFGNELISDYKLESLIAETARKIALQ
jgi:TPR repeat protein